MKEIFGHTKEGKTAYLYTLKNQSGLELQITNYGGIVHSIQTPDKEGKFEDILLGFKDFDGYLSPVNPYFGCIVGRVANRIANAKFVLDGKEYKLIPNTGNDHLHGGVHGFDKVFWDVIEIQNEETPGLELSYLSPDGEEGYPGNLLVKVKYELTNNNEFKISYLATTDKATPVNLTHHAYFNLTGNCKRNVMEHLVRVNASAYTEINDNLLPTGQISRVEGSPLDFRQMKAIGKDFHKTSAGYDHNFVLDGEGLRKVAEVIEPQSKRKMEVYTGSVGMQFYTGNFLDNNIIGKKGVPYKNQDGFCFETQYFPDSPNIDSFPSNILRPENKFEQLTIYRFTVEE